MAEVEHICHTCSIRVLPILTHMFREPNNFLMRLVSLDIQSDERATVSCDAQSITQKIKNRIAYSWQLIREKPLGGQ